MSVGSDKPSEGVPFGRYLLRERLGRGGMGEVFRAVAIGASGFEKPVVVKRILPQLQSEERFAAMFADEARLMTRLAHPNIVQVIDFGQGAEQDYFLVLELVDGMDLGQFREHYQGRREHVPMPIALRVVQQMLRGLAHAHERAYDDGRVLVHRDVSPGNVLLSTVGEVKIGDFGVALAAESQGGSAARPPVVGKPGYMAPEQSMGDPVDPRADLFSVAVVLFELLTDESPFPAPTAAARQAEAALGRFRSASSLRPEVPVDLEALLARALSPLPEQRFPSARTMASALEALQSTELRIANADDLADAVQRARAGGPRRALPVLALGADPGGADPTPVGELTRTSGARFTMSWVDRVTAPSRDEPAPKTPSQPGRSADERRGRTAGRPTPGTTSSPRRGTWLVLLLAAIAAAGIGGVWLSRERGASDGDSRPPAADPSAPGSELPIGGAGAAPASSSGVGPVAEETTGAGNDVVSAQAPGTPRLALPSGSARASSPSLPAVTTSPSESAGPEGAAPTRVPTASAVAACQGHVHLYASHGWSVSGGPGTVQAPGRYVWPCGAYALRATSRLDPSESRQLSVAVQAGQTAVVDLRP